MRKTRRTLLVIAAAAFSLQIMPGLMVLDPATVPGGKPYEATLASAGQDTQPGAAPYSSTDTAPDTVPGGQPY
ncbi:hypothetical protein F0L68_20510 [Solihabitans fulvus]|uniref:Uncharacterized protein n=1 Tax=Solihabitans fulvus TaxID=1892852 RepID=A0A5B2XAL3_9PSEU|nr:hypothetical protein [Solihabitans fulvus]KAA2260111.1 hypothetical protein F0L68_20510 [Solihabitans fulvus]